MHLNASLNQIIIKSINMYEHKRAPLAPKRVFYKRIFVNLTLTVIVLSFCLVIGTIGYYITNTTNDNEPVNFLDCFHNASMILGGMGPVLTRYTTSGKWFSSFYALFSGIIFITNIGIVLAPAIHRFFHKLHLEEGKN